jgi:hypothetical protein
VELTELVKSVQANLTRLKRYFTANKLTLNADKTYSYLGTEQEIVGHASIILWDITDKRGERSQIPWTSN